MQNAVQRQCKMIPRQFLSMFLIIRLSSLALAFVAAVALACVYGIFFLLLFILHLCALHLSIVRFYADEDLPGLVKKRTVLRQTSKGFKLLGDQSIEWLDKRRCWTFRDWKMNALMTMTLLMLMTTAYFQQHNRELNWITSTPQCSDNFKMWFHKPNFYVQSKLNWRFVCSKVATRKEAKLKR